MDEPTFKKIIDGINDIVIITDVYPIDAPDGPRILYVNQRFTEVTGYTAQEVIGKTPRLLHGPKTNRDTLDAIKEALKNKTPIRVELLNYTKSSEHYWVALSISHIENPDTKKSYFVSIQQDITKQKQLEIERSQTFCLDPLTGLHSRHEFFERGEELIHSMRRYNDLFGLLLLNFDNFKQVNIKHGYREGDNALCQIADLCKLIFRKSDFICRFDGDEFIILVDRVEELDDLRRKAELLCDKIKVISNELVTVSIGGTLAKLSDTSLEDILTRAEYALHESKKGQKGWVHII